MTKRIVIWSLVILTLLLIVAVIAFGPYIALFFTLKFGRRENDFDAAKYRNYICYDSNLACIDAKDGSSTEYITFSDGYSYYFTYRRALDVSEDQFVCVTMKNSFPLSTKKCYIFQDPENRTNVWTDWTIKEIQVYYQDINQSVSLPEEEEPARTPNGIVATIQDEACLAELLDFVTSDAYHTISAIREDMNSVENLSAEYNAYVKMYVRVIFHESETIVWDAEITGYTNRETGERYVSIYKDTTAWDETAYYCGIDSKEFLVENLPVLEGYLLGAIDSLMEDLGSK